MDSDDYKRGVDDVLKWVERDLFPNSYTFDELKGTFWKDRKTLTDDERYKAFVNVADRHILALREVLEHYEMSEPETFAKNPSWFEAYVRYAWAKHLKGDTI